MVLALIVAWQWGRHRGHVGQAMAIGALSGLGMALYASGLVHSSVVLPMGVLI